MSVGLTARTCYLPILALMLSGFAWANPHKEIDLRKFSDQEGSFTIGLCARPSPDTQVPGHAFVAYSHLSPQGQRRYFAIGHTTKQGPKEAVLSWFGFSEPISGVLEEEKYTAALEKCLVLKVNKKDYEAALALAQDPFKKLGITSQETPLLLAYKLGVQDCLTYMIHVATLFEKDGLKVPQREQAELPLSYIRRVIEIN